MIEWWDCYSPVKGLWSFRAFTSWLVGILKAHFEPKPLLITERYRFYQRTQTAVESVQDFVAELQLPATLELSSMKALWDQFVCGLKADTIQKCLLAEDGLTMAEIAQGMEAAAWSWTWRIIPQFCKCLGQDRQAVVVTGVAWWQRILQSQLSASHMWPTSLRPPQRKQATMHNHHSHRSLTLLTNCWEGGAGIAYLYRSAKPICK